MIMYLTGHFELFVDSVFITRTMGESSDNTHNLGRLVVKDLIAANKIYINEEEQVISFENISMYFYLSNTVPILKNPWPGMYPADFFIKDMTYFLDYKKVLPGVVLQKVNTLNTNWPENESEEYLEKSKENLRIECFMNFLDQYNYTKVLENKAFAIFNPVNF